MKVLKFGTSTIATVEKIKGVAKLVSETTQSIIVLSAIAGTTDQLSEITDYLYKKNPEGANEAINKFQKEYTQIISNLFETENIQNRATEFLTNTIRFIRSLTKNIFTSIEEKALLAQGEILSSNLLVFLLKEKNVNVAEIAALDFMRIDKKNEPDSASIQEKLTQLLQQNKADIYITQGYICKNAYDEIDNFQIGGSDYTAALIGAAIEAEEIQIWTGFDVKTSNNSQLLFNTEEVHRINFEEAAELAYFGAKILHPMCIFPAKIANIPVRLLNILEPQQIGIYISNETEKNKIKALASKDGITAINVKSSRMLLAKGFLRKFCEIFETHMTAIDMLTTSEIGISVTIDSNKYLDEITDNLKKLGTVTVEKNMTLLSIVGDLQSQQGSPISRIINALKDIPVRMMSYGGSESNLSILIDKKQKDETLHILSEKIF